MPVYHCTMFPSTCKSDNIPSVYDYMYMYMYTYTYTISLTFIYKL